MWRRGRVSLSLSLVVSSSPSLPLLFLLQEASCQITPGSEGRRRLVPSKMEGMERRWWIDNGGLIIVAELRRKTRRLMMRRRE